MRRVPISKGSTVVAQYSGCTTLAGCINVQGSFIAIVRLTPVIATFFLFHINLIIINANIIVAITITSQPQTRTKYKTIEKCGGVDAWGRLASGNCFCSLPLYTASPNTSNFNVKMSTFHEKIKPRLEPSSEWYHHNNAKLCPLTAGSTLGVPCL